MLGKLEIHGCSLCLQWFWWTELETTAKTKKKHQKPRQTTKTTAKTKKKTKKNTPFSNYLSKPRFLVVFLCFYRGFGGQQLETTAKTKKKHQKPRQTTKTTAKTKENNHFQTISQNQEFVVFLGFYRDFGGQQLETTAKTKKSHQKTWFREIV